MKLSIITINHNNIDGLRRTIESVLIQAWCDFEWIIVDGGSTDGSKELIEDTTKICQNISYWCSEPDMGIYNAMNKGIRLLSGQYVIFLNSGDYFLNKDVMADFVQNNPTEDIVYGYVERHINGKQQRLTGFLHKSNITLTDLYYQTIPHQGTFFRTSMFEKYGLYDESLRILADRKFYVQSIIYGNASVRFIPLSIAYFDEGGVSGSDIYEKEKSKVLHELFPPRIYNDLVIAKSVKEIQEASFLTSKLYSALYKLAMILRNKF